MPAMAFKSCESLDTASVRRLVALELEVSAIAQQPLTFLSVTLFCSDARAEIRLSSASTEPLRVRQVDLQSFPLQSRPRLLAMEIVALLEEHNRATQKPVPAALPSSVTRTTSPELAFFLSPLYLRTGTPTVGSWGLAVGLARPLLSFCHVLGELRGAWPTWQSSLGPVKGKDFSLGIAAPIGRTWGPIWLGVGPGFRIGLLWLQGQPSGTTTPGRSFWGFWWGPLLRGHVTLPLYARIRLMLHGEGGWVLRPVRGLLLPPQNPLSNQTPTFGQAGHWLSGGLGLWGSF